MAINQTWHWMPCYQPWFSASWCFKNMQFRWIVSNYRGHKSGSNIWRNFVLILW